MKKVVAGARLDADVKKELDKKATENDRSFSAEVNRRLRISLKLEK